MNGKLMMKKPVCRLYLKKVWSLKAAIRNRKYEDYQAVRECP